VCVVQPPGFGWSDDQIRLEIGLTADQLAYLERLCYRKLINITDAVHHPRALSPKNLLLLTLKWLWHYPSNRVVANDFGICPKSVLNTVAVVLRILDENLAYLCNASGLGRHRIRRGPLKDTVMAIDSFPVCIPKPPIHPPELRKEFFLYKKDHKTRFAWKIQLCADLKGKIVSVSSAYPYGSISDIRLLRESDAAKLLGPTSRAIRIPQNPVDRLNHRAPQCAEEKTELKEAQWEAEDEKEEIGEEEGEDDEKAENEEAEEEAEEDEEDAEEAEEAEEAGETGETEEAEDSDAAKAEETEQLDHKHAVVMAERKGKRTRALSRGIADKAYQGHEWVYVPYKRYKNKRLSQKKKAFNKLLGSKRVKIEHVNKRIEDFKVLSTVYRGRRNPHFMSLIVRVVVGLYNLKIEEELKKTPKRQH
jgi:hypothetical protein